MSKKFQIKLTVTKYMSWGDYEKKKQNKEFKKKIDGARIYYIIGKTDELEKILYIGSTRQNITTRIKFNHRGFVKALRNGWNEESLGISFGYYEEPLVLPKEVEGYLINKHKPIYNASTPNFKVVSRVNEIGSFDLPMISINQYGALIDRNGSRIPREKQISPTDVVIEWRRYLENLPDENSDKACLCCNKLIDETVPEFTSNVISFDREYDDWHRDYKGFQRRPDEDMRSFCTTRQPDIRQHYERGEIEYTIATYSFQVPISDIAEVYQHRSLHLFCSIEPRALRNYFLESYRSTGRLPRFDPITKSRR